MTMIVLFALFDIRLINYIFSKDNFNIFKNLCVELDLVDLRRYYRDYQDLEFVVNLSNTFMKLLSYNSWKFAPVKMICSVL